MTGSEYVDGSGWISDESDFYGDEDTRLQLEQKVKRGSNRPLYYPEHHVSAKKQRTTAEAEDVQQASPAPESSAQQKTKSANPASRSVASEKAADIVKHEKPRDSSATWQQGETIGDFLKRLPIADPKTAEVGAWVWVHSPATKQGVHRPAENEDITAFIETAAELQEAFRKRRTAIEAELDGKAQATITRRINPHRDILERDLLNKAIEANVTCGKWMLFPSREDLPRLWRQVAEATSQGKLGPVSKVATPDASSRKDETLICVYTYDFADIDDVRRVLHELLNRGVVQRDSKPIYYKCDAYTYLGIQSDNQYKLRASLFSSKEILSGNVKTNWTR